MNCSSSHCEEDDGDDKKPAIHQTAWNVLGVALSSLLWKVPSYLLSNADD